jgi:farnesyl diphosphate synthase
MNEISLWQKMSQTRVQAFLNKVLISRHNELNRFFESMRYASLEGGKRIRAMLTFATGAYLNVPDTELDIYAAAIEMIHAFSLVHDDLPAMDNDVLRRGQPTCHVAFGESTAILCGDALLTEAFSILSGTITPYFHSLKRVKMLHILAQSMGANGMAGGQYLDIQAEGKSLDFEGLSLLHQLKTGALIEACISLPLIYAEPAAEIAENLQNFSKHIGLLFQIQDDLLDVSGSTAQLGKTAGKDEIAHKASFVRILGQTGAQDLLHNKTQAAQSCLAALPGDTQLLTLILNFVVQREY